MWRGCLPKIGDGYEVMKLREIYFSEVFTNQHINNILSRILTFFIQIRKQPVTTLRR